MAMGSGVLTVFGTTIVAALAVGAAIGVHELVGTPDDRPGTDIAMSDDFCTLMGEMTTYVMEQTAAIGGDGETLDLSGGEDPAVLDAIHAQGEATLDFTRGLVAYQNHAAEIVSDADVAEAFRDGAAAWEIQGDAFARISIDATSVEGFIAAAFSATLSPEDQAIVDRGEAASEAYSEYVADECGLGLGSVFGSDDASSAGLNAKADVATLGMEIAVYFVDWAEGDPLPVVAIDQGFYYLLDVQVAAVSEGVELVDQSVTASDDWCVSVSYQGSAEATYRYSAIEGLGDGTCAALAGT